MSQREILDCAVIATEQLREIIEILEKILDKLDEKEKSLPTSDLRLEIRVEWGKKKEPSSFEEYFIERKKD